ncbi:MAG: hypothetical protein IT204_04870 [Fimbriimonadaceae bacterium]|nr:hypothetical protein [Fimbriimonadaceae bacterium]
MSASVSRETAPGDPAAPGPAPAVVAWRIVGLVTLWYALTSCYVAADGDGLKETGLLLGSGSGLRAYHLFQTPWLRLWLQGWQMLGWQGPEQVPPQLCNALCGGLSAGLLWRLAQLAGLSARSAGALVAVFVLSANPWAHARTVETGITPLPLELAALWLLWPREGGRPGARSAALAAVCAAGGVLLALNLVVLLPALLVAAARGGRRAALAFGATTVVLLSACYLLAAWREAVLAPAAFVSWVLHHEDSKGLAAARGVLGALRALIGLGRLVWPVSAGETAVKAVLRGEPVLVDPTAWLTLLRNGLTAAALSWWTLAGWWPRRRTAAGGILTWAFAVQAVFNLIWLGSDPQYWLPLYPLLLLAAAWRLAAGSGRWLLWPSLVALLATNLPTSLPSPLYPRWGHEWVVARQVAAQLPSRASLVLCGNSALRLVHQVRPDVGVIDLVYQPPEELEGAAFERWLSPTLALAAAGGPLYVEGLRDPYPARLLGNFEMLAGTHRIGRGELAAWLDQRYRRQPGPGLPSELERLEPR